MKIKLFKPIEEMKFFTKTGKAMECKFCKQKVWVKRCKQEKFKFCCWKCLQSSKNIKNKQIIKKCAFCDKSFTPFPSEIARGGGKFCSQTCSSSSRRKNKSESKTSCRSWLELREKIEKCEKCNFSSHPEILQIHHKDRNRENNERANLEILCPNCHSLEHFEDRKRNWGVIKPPSA